MIKEAKVQQGLFPLWRKDEKVWIEIPKAALNKPFLFTVNIANSVGERGLYASQMGMDHLVEFRRIGNQLQLIALNTKFRAVADQGSKRAIDQAFSPSLLGSSVVASAEHPERKSVLVDAAFLLGDIPGYSTRLEMAYRLPFAPDRANSFFEAVRTDERLTTLTARMHFATPRIPAPPLMPMPSPVPAPTPPQATPDPRSGEILDADIGMSDVFVRGGRAFISEDVGRAGAHSHALQGDAFCNYAHEAAAELDFALDMLEARGNLEPGSPEADAFIQARVKDVIMHEVGHTLGLKHNFKASTTITQAQLKDKAYTDAFGISGSVMDYNAYNIAAKGEQQASFNNATLGAYDYWAIEYAYKPIAAGSEAVELGKIAARSTEPALAYADDADAGGFGPNDGMDPLANRFDLGDDPLAYYKKRLKLSQELWSRVQDRKPQAGDDPLRQRRSILSGFNQLYRAAELVGKYVGGMTALRDLPGSTGRASFTPVDPVKQREALQFLATGLFSIDSFRFRPEFLSTLTVDYNEWDRGGPLNLPAAVARVQLVALDRLLNANTAARLLDLSSYVPESQRRGLISLSEVYATLQTSIWAELKTGAEVERLRRNLQREYLKRLQAVLTRPPANLPPDALSLARLHATQLQANLRLAVAKGGLSVESRAHLADSLGSLTEALRATMQRS